jgi:hypothetical protein
MRAEIRLQVLNLIGEVALHSLVDGGEGLIDGGDAKKVPILLVLLFAAQAVGGKQLLIAGHISLRSKRARDAPCKQNPEPHRFHDYTQRRSSGIGEVFVEIEADGIVDRSNLRLPSLIA